jgi:hypothetical protein
MQKRTIEKLEQFKSYPMLLNVGTAARDAPIQIGSWKEAAKHCKSRMWDGCLMMASNALSTFAHQRDWDRGHEWNTLATEIRPEIVSWLEPTIAPIVTQHHLPKIVVDSLRWYLMHICFEVEYEDIVEPLFYLPLIDPWLQRGHFPCGWVGEEFPDGWNGVLPEGKLVVF